MKIIALGTSSAVPTRYRNHSSFLLQYKGNNILFDCGEGTQRQLIMQRISPTKIDKIFLTHWHGDHILGLPGIIMTCAMGNRMKPLEIYGPKGSKVRFEHLKKALHESFKSKFSIRVIDVTKEIVFENEDYVVSANSVKHAKLPSVSYSFKEKDKLKINLNYVKKFGLTKHKILGELQKGKDIKYEGKKIKVRDATIPIIGRKIVYVGDGRLDSSFKKFAKDADLIISEATYTEKYHANAVKHTHMTAKEVAEHAKNSGAKKLVLTHFSRKITDPKDILREAKRYFKGTVVIAKDFLEIKL